MGVAYYPVFERKIDGYNPSVLVNGKPIARAMARLEEICKRLGITPLMGFYSESNEEVFAKIGEPVPPGMREDPVRWSEPEQGLRTVVGLMDYLRDYPAELPDAARIREDLEGFRQVFLKAQEHQTRFRLRIDI
jgi:hypothetical protein